MALTGVAYIGMFLEVEEADLGMQDADLLQRAYTQRVTEFLAGLRGVKATTTLEVTVIPVRGQSARALFRGR